MFIVPDLHKILNMFTEQVNECCNSLHDSSQYMCKIQKNDFPPVAVTSRDRTG